MCQIVGVTKPQTSQGGPYEHYSIFPSKHFAYRNNICTFALKSTNHKYGKTMIELTKDKKRALLAACHGMKSPGIQMGGKPVLTIGWDGEIHGIRSNSIKKLYIIPFSKNLRQSKNLFNGNTKLSNILKRF